MMPSKPSETKVSKQKQQEKIEKVESHQRLSVPSSREAGYNGLVDARRFIATAAQKELQFPQLVCTIDRMLQDDAVSTAVDATKQQMVTALGRGEYKGTTPAGKVAADFLNYAIRNMTSGNWHEACQDFATCLEYGFSIVLPVTERRKYGQYAGNYVLKKLSPRSQQSIYGWVWDDPMQNVVGFVQRPKWRQRKPDLEKVTNRALRLIDTPKIRNYEYTYIDFRKALHFKNKGSVANPQGVSQCAGVYETWLEKQLLQHLELTGAQKDLAGTLITRIPSELVSAATSGNDPLAEAEYRELQADTANVHQGKSTGITLLSDRDSSGNFLYDIELKGITGSGKQIEIDTIIDAKRNAIFNKFFAQFLILGQGDVGSNAAAKTGQSIHDQFVSFQVDQIVEVLNNRLAPMLLAVNDIYLDDKDMPRFIPADPSTPSIDEWGKFLQRTGSLGMVTQIALEHVYRELNIPTEGIEELNFNQEDISQAGTGFGTSGGSVDTQTNSDNNPENSS